MAVRTTALTLAVGAALCAALLGQSNAATPAPHTVLTIPGVIRSFALGPQRLAWVEATWELRVRSLTTGRTTTARYTNQHFEDADPSLVFSGSRPVWLSETGIALVTARVFTTTSAGRPRAVEKVHYQDGVDGDFVTGISGDSTGGVYGVAIFHDTSGTESGPFDLDGGGVWTVANGASHRVAQVPPPAYLARSGEAVALIPMASTTPNPAPDLTPTDTVTVASLPSGRTLATFAVTGAPQAIALTPQFVFVLVQNGADRSIEVHEPRNGKLVRRVSAPRINRLAPKLSASGAWVVYHDQRTVSALDGGTGRVKRVATTTWLVRQALIQKTTVAWSEQKGGGSDTLRANYTSRIREVTLP